MDKISTQAVMLKKVIEKKRLKPLVLELTKRMERLDESKILEEEAIEQRKNAAPKKEVDKEAIERTGIERRLEESDEILSQLIAVSNELVTNVKVANEKREIVRRNIETAKRELLESDLDQESAEAMARLDEITSKWSELRLMKEPMGLFEELEEQKARITALMKQKDDIIEECQNELIRIDESYYIDQERQNADIYCLIERVDDQVSLIKRSYNEHLDLLQDCIEVERKTLFNKMSEDWKSLYDKQTHHEDVKHENQKEKSRFYDNELSRITREQDEITRSTRIRLERDAEALQLELKKVKNTVLMNTEKMDYNYQVLQKRNEENVIVSNQQKRRVGRIMETITILKKKITDAKLNSELNIKNLTKEILQLQSNILDLEAKAERFRVLNEKRYNTVWDMNQREAIELANKVLDIDRLLYEHQLGLDWTRPKFLHMQKTDLSSFRKESSRSPTADSSGKFTKNAKAKSSRQAETSQTDDEKQNENLLRNILFQIADRAGFLCEERLMDVLEPYSEEDKTLVRIDNILNALNINNFDDVKALTKYFLPYAFCPNCSDGIRVEDFESEFDSASPSRASPDSDSPTHEQGIGQSIMSKVRQMEGMSKNLSERSGASAYEDYNDEIEQQIDDLISKSYDKTECGDAGETGRRSSPSKCANHYLTIEPSLVIRALKKFAEQHLEKNSHVVSSSRKNSEAKTPPNIISNDEVKKYWEQFKGIIPEEKFKLWKCIEHGLNHYLVTLRDREDLDKQCEFLRRQNAELKHLLTRYLPEDRQQ